MKKSTSFRVAIQWMGMVKGINYINSLCLISLIAMAALFDLVTPLNLVTKAGFQPQTESDFVGTFTGPAGDGRLEEEWTITNAGGTWNVVGTFYWSSGAEKGKVAGGFTSENVRMENGVLKFKQVFTKKAIATWADSSNIEATVAGDTLTFKNQYVSNIKLKRKGAQRSASRDEEPSANEPADVEVLEVVGEVELAPGGDDSQAYPMRGGEQIDEADRIFTGMDSYAILRFRRDGHIVKVGQVTDAKVGVYRDEGTYVQYRILIRGGEVSCEVNKRTERPAVFEVKTPTATCGVRGTKFTVRHDEKAGVSAISVTEGVVEVTPENTSLQAFNLSANQSVEVSAKEISQITNITDSPGAATPQLAGQPAAVSQATPQPSAVVEKGGVSVIAVLVAILVGLVVAGALVLIIRSRGRAA